LQHWQSWPCFTSRLTLNSWLAVYLIQPRFIVVQVEQFDEIPVICGRNYCVSTKYKMMEGEIYTRTRTKPQSTKVMNYLVISTGLIYPLSKLYKELIKKRGMSIEEVASVVDIDLNILPDMERRLEQTTKALARKEVDLDMIKNHISSLEEEEKRRRNRIVTLPPSSYHNVENRENLAMNAFPYYSDPTSTPSLLPYWPSGDHDPWIEYRNKQKNSKEKAGNSWDV
jgi:hypothetical protein